MRSLFGKAILFGVLIFLPFAVSADTLGLSPSSGAYVVGKIFPVTIYVTSTSQAINAVSGTLSYPTDKLSVVSVSKAGSILTLWVSEPTYSNNTGVVNFEGVVPNPGFQGVAGRIIVVNFKVVGQGSAAVKWNAGSVLANDGSGTNILKNLNTGSFVLGGSGVPAEVPPADIPVAPRSPGGLVVTSDNFPDSTKWYSIDFGTFSWKLTDSTTAVRMLVGKQSGSTPSVVYEPPIAEKKIDKLDDGVWYFHLQAKDNGSWGSVTHYQFRVDTTAPESFSVKEIVHPDLTDPRPKFAFSASDSTSGIDHYTVEIDGGTPVIWRDDGGGIWQPSALPPGDHTLLVKAYDEAGNSTPASVDFTIEPIPTPKITYYTDKITGSAPIVVRGTTEPNFKVKLSLKKGGILSGSDDVLTSTIQSDEDGTWSTAMDPSKIASGAYNLSAIAVDRRGAQSLPTAPKTVLVNAGWLRSIGGTILTVLAVAVPVLALLFLLFIIFMRGFHTVRMTNRKFRSELHNIEHLVDQSFLLLKEDVEDSVRLLEKTKSRRKLTEEEEAIIERLRQNLRDAEKVIHGQVRRIEREI